MAAATAAVETAKVWKPTASQRAQLVRAFKAQLHCDNDGWVRSRDHGERVTLASLHYRGFLQRRCWAGAGTSSPAHEYKLHAPVYQQFYTAMQRHRVAQGGNVAYREAATNAIDGRSTTMAAAEEAPAAPAASEAKPDPKPSTKAGTAAKKSSGTSKASGKATGKAAGKATGAAAKASTAKASGDGTTAKASKPRVEKTSAAAKAARAEMDTHAEGFKAYTDAQVAKAKAVEAGNDKEAAKQQKIMDANRATYTARRAAYRAYQAAPAA